MKLTHGNSRCTFTQTELESSAAALERLEEKETSLKKSNYQLQQQVAESQDQVEEERKMKLLLQNRLKQAEDELISLKDQVGVHSFGVAVWLGGCLRLFCG